MVSFKFSTVLSRCARGGLLIQLTGSVGHPWFSWNS